MCGWRTTAGTGTVEDLTKTEALAILNVADGAEIGTVTEVLAGTGMTQTGTSTADPTLNVIGGSGITANADNIELGALTGDWDAGSFDITAEQLHSDIAIGTAPLTVVSTTVVDNLNADLLDDQTGSYYL